MEAFSLISFQLTPEQKDAKHRFISAKSSSELLEAFKGLEGCFCQFDLVPARYFVVHTLYHQYMDFEKVIIFGKKTMEIMLLNNLSDLMVDVVGMVGSSCSRLNRLSECFKYFRWAERLLEKVEDTIFDPDHTVLKNLHSIRLELFDVKRRMGINEDCITYLVKNLSTVEKKFGVHSKALADANKEICYRPELSEAASLPYCLRALEIYLACRGDNSKEIAECSKHIGTIYTALGDSEKALGHYRLSHKVYKELACTSISAEVEASWILIKLGRLDEAVHDLRGTVDRAREDSVDHVAALMTLSSAFVKQEKVADAKEYLENVRRILAKKVNERLYVAYVLEQVAEVYGRMNDSETSIFVMQEAIQVLEKEEEASVSRKNSLFEKLSVRLGQQLVLIGKPEEAIPYVEVEVESAKKIYGSRHTEVGRSYSILGSVYLHSNKLQLAAEAFTHAKDILDEILGSHHEDSIKACKSLYMTYKEMGRYSLAITYLEETIKRQKLLGPSVQDDLGTGARLMAELKELASGDISAKDSQSASNPVKIQNQIGWRNVPRTEQGSEVPATKSIYEFSWNPGSP